MAGNNNLIILFTATLNQGLSIKEINSAIKKIEKHPSLRKIKLQIDIEKETLNAIKKIAKLVPKNMPTPIITPKIGKMSQQEFAKLKFFASSVGNAMDNAMNSVKHKFGADSIVSSKGIKDGEGNLQKIIITARNTKGQLEQVDFLLREIEGHTTPKWISTMIKDTNKAEAEFEKLSKQITKQMRTINASGELSSQKRTGMNKVFGNAMKSGDLNELLKFQNKYKSELEGLLPVEKKVENYQKSLKDTLQDLANKEMITTKEFNNFNKSVDSKHNIEELKKIDKQIIETKRLSENAEKVNNYKKIGSIQATSLNKTNGSVVNKGLMDSYLQQLNQLDSSSLTLERDLKRLDTLWKEIQKDAVSSAKSEDMMLQMEKNRLRTQYQVALIQKKITGEQFTKLNRNLKNASNPMNVKDIENENKKLMATYTYEKKITEEIEKQKQKIKEKLDDTKVADKLPANTRVQMQTDFASVNQIGTMKALMEFQKKYRVELGMTSTEERKEIATKDSLRNQILKLAKSMQLERDEQGKLTESGIKTRDVLRSIGNGINTRQGVRQLQNLEGEMKKLQEVANFKNQMDKRINTIMSSPNGTKIKGSLAREMDSIRTALRSLDHTQSVGRLNSEMRILEQRLNVVNNRARATSMSVTRLFAEALKKFPIWMVTATVFYAPLRALKDMADRIIEIDTAMTELKRVMDAPEFKFEELLNGAVEASDELASKLTDVLKIMGDFARTGFDDSQLMDMTKTAQVLQNISDLDASSSVDTLTSAMINFNVSAQDSIKIADKLNEVVQ